MQLRLGMFVDGFFTSVNALVPQISKSLGWSAIIVAAASLASRMLAFLEPLKFIKSANWLLVTLRNVPEAQGYDSSTDDSG